MRRKTTIILAALCIVETAVFIRSRYVRKGADDARETSILAVGSDEKRVHRVEIERTTDGQTDRIVFEQIKDPEWYVAKWDIIEPIGDWADNFKISDIIAALNGMKNKGSSEAKDLARYGLDKPSGKVTVIFAEDWKREPVTLLIGKPALPDASGEGNVYVKLEAEDAVRVVGDAVVGTIRRELAAYRSKDVLRFHTHRINKLEMSYRSRSLTCVKKNGRWRITSPVAARANQQAVGELVEKIRFADREKFITDGATTADVVKYGLDKPVVRARLWSIREGEPVRELAIGNPGDGNGQLYARTTRNKVIFTVKIELLTDLVKKVADLRDRDVVDFAADDVVEVKIESGGTEIALSRAGKDDNWKMSAPGERDTDLKAVGDLVTAITKLEALDWPAENDSDAGRFGLKDPAATVTVTALERKRTESGDPAEKAARTISFIVGKTEGDSCYVKRTEEPAIIRVSGESHGKLTAGYLTYVSRRVFDFKKAGVRKLSIDRGGKLHVCSLEKGEWMLKEPVEGRADQRVVEDILWRLSTLNAVDVIAEDVKDFAPYGLDRPIITVTIGLENGETLQLCIGGLTKAGRYFARLAGKNTVFTVKLSVVGFLSTDLTETAEKKPK